MLELHSDCLLWPLSQIQASEKATKLKRTVQTTYKTATVNGIFRMEMYACIQGFFDPPGLYSLAQAYIKQNSSRKKALTVIWLRFRCGIVTNTWKDW